MFCYKKRPEQFHISLEQNLNFFSSASKLKFGTKSFKRDLISIHFFNQLSKKYAVFLNGHAVGLTKNPVINDSTTFLDFWFLIQIYNTNQNSQILKRN